MSARFGFTVAFVVVACGGSMSSELVGTSALELDGDGHLTCADLDHLMACVHHPHDAICHSSDLNHDGVIDAHDAQVAHDSLAAVGLTCVDPASHFTTGTTHEESHDGGTVAHDGGH